MFSLVRGVFPASDGIFVLLEVVMELVALSLWLLMKVYLAEVCAMGSSLLMTRWLKGHVVLDSIQIFCGLVLIVGWFSSLNPRSQMFCSWCRSFQRRLQLFAWLLCHISPLVLWRCPPLVVVLIEVGSSPMEVEVEGVGDVWLWWL